jgi:hypothetical protein
MTNSAEGCHLSDIIGHRGANFSGDEPESISNSVFYVSVGNVVVDIPIENMWLWIVPDYCSVKWSVKAITAVTIECHVMINAIRNIQLAFNWLGLLEEGSIKAARGRKCCALFHKLC